MQTAKVIARVMCMIYFIPTIHPAKPKEVKKKSRRKKQTIYPLDTQEDGVHAPPSNFHCKKHTHTIQRTWCLMMEGRTKTTRKKGGLL